MCSCGAHCRGCDRCFSSTKTFDRHFAGSFRDHTRHCCDPEGVDGLVGRAGGVCRNRGAGTLKGVTVWGSPDREEEPPVI